MNVLYVSDLDGTLLNDNQKVDMNVAKQINKLIDNGINFTISTGRGNSIKEILKDIHFKIPVMVLNGALNYDFDKKEYVDSKAIPNKKVLEIIESFKGFSFEKFQIQTLVNNNLSCLAVSDWNRESDCLAFNILNTEERIEGEEEILSKISGINFFLNKKVYSNNEWFCDIIAEGVSKASSLRDLKEKYRFDKIIAFGDSENDLPLAEVADEFYAVANAADAVKQRAAGVIGSCHDNGVVNFIMQNS